MDTESIPSKKAKASAGFIANVKGSIRARVVGSEIPGMIPIMKRISPRISPQGIIKGNVGQVKTWMKLEKSASSPASDLLSQGAGASVVPTTERWCARLGAA